LNTSSYLKKEVDAVEDKIDEAKQALLKEIGLNLYHGDDITNGK
jgi:hypothetical protein